MKPKILTRIMTSSTIALCLTACAQAQDSNSDIIDRAINAYGGAALTGLNSIRVQDDILRIEDGAGYFVGAETIEVERRDFNLDFANNKVSLEILIDRGSEMYHARTSHTDTDLVWMNYVSGIYHDMEDEGYHGFARPIRPIDTILAYELNHHRDTARITGSSTYAGQPHQIVSYEIPQFPGPINLHINLQTGLISLMETDIDDNHLRVVYGNHKRAEGLAFAHNTKVYNGSDLLAQSINRRITANKIDKNLFQMDGNFQTEPEMVNRTELTVTEVAKGTHIVGQSYGHTVFVDAGDHLVAIDTAAGFKNRLESYRAETGNQKPLKYAVVSLHHSHHVSGVKDVLEAGGIIVTTQSTLAQVKEEAGEDIPDDRVKLVSGHAVLGPVEMHVINTPLAEDHVIAYIPSAKTIYQADLYVGLYEDGPWTPGIGAKQLKDYLEANNLDVTSVLSAHAPKIETWADFAEGVANYKYKACQNNREICRD